MECNWTPSKRSSHLSFRPDDRLLFVKVFVWESGATRVHESRNTESHQIAQLSRLLTPLAAFKFQLCARDAPNAPTSRASTCRTARRGHRAQARRISLVSGGALQRPLSRRAHATSVVQ